ncbi:MAG: hypothetical protein LBI29_02985, partial [Rickettsiales bacterium]|nr:hypothetical protein [Rickettsiales bacterium]
EKPEEGKEGEGGGKIAEEEGPEEKSTIPGEGEEEGEIEEGEIEEEKPSEGEEGEEEATEEKPEEGEKEEEPNHNSDNNSTEVEDSNESLDAIKKPRRENKRELEREKKELAEEEEEEKETLSPEEKGAKRGKSTMRTSIKKGVKTGGGEGEEDTTSNSSGSSSDESSNSSDSSSDLDENDKSTEDNEEEKVNEEDGENEEENFGNHPNGNDNSEAENTEEEVEEMRIGGRPVDLVKQKLDNLKNLYRDIAESNEPEENAKRYAGKDGIFSIQNGLVDDLMDASKKDDILEKLKKLEGERKGVQKKDISRLEKALGEIGNGYESDGADSPARRGEIYNGLTQIAMCLARKEYNKKDEEVEEEEEEEEEEKEEGELGEPYDNSKDSKKGNGKKRKKKKEETGNKEEEEQEQEQTESRDFDKDFADHIKEAEEKVEEVLIKELEEEKGKEHFKNDNTLCRTLAEAERARFTAISNKGKKDNKNNDETIEVEKIAVHAADGARGVDWNELSDSYKKAVKNYNNSISFQNFKDEKNTNGRTLTFKKNGVTMTLKLNKEQGENFDILRMSEYVGKDVGMFGGLLEYVKNDPKCSIELIDLPAMIEVKSNRVVAFGKQEEKAQTLLANFGMEDPSGRQTGELLTGEHRKLFEESFGYAKSGKILKEIYRKAASSVTSKSK